MCGMENATSPYIKISNDKHESNFVQNILSVFLMKKYFDLVFICKGNVQVPVHKIVVASVSEYLGDIIRSSSQDVLFISVPDIYADNLQIIIDFLYEGFTEVTLAELVFVKDIIRLLGIRLYNTEVKRADSEGLPTAAENAVPTSSVEDITSPYIPVVDSGQSFVPAKQKNAQTLFIPVEIKQEVYEFTEGSADFDSVEESVDPLEIQETDSKYITFGLQQVIKSEKCINVPDSNVETRLTSSDDGIENVSCLPTISIGNDQEKDSSLSFSDIYKPFTKEQETLLEEMFKINMYPPFKERTRLCRQFKVPHKYIYGWFADKRKKIKETIENNMDTFSKSDVSEIPLEFAIDLLCNDMTEPKESSEVNIEVSFDMTDDPLILGCNSKEQNSRNVPLNYPCNNKDIAKTRPSRRKRNGLSREREKVLEMKYNEEKFPTLETLREISKEMGKPPAKLIHWFDRRRAEDGTVPMEKTRTLNKELRSVLAEFVKKDMHPSFEETLYFSTHWGVKQYCVTRWINSKLNKRRNRKKKHAGKALAKNVEIIPSPSDDVNGNTDNSSASAVSINLQPKETAGCISNIESNIIYESAEVDIKHYMVDDVEEKLVNEVIIDHVDAGKTLEMDNEIVQLPPVSIKEENDNGSMLIYTTSLNSEETIEGENKDLTMTVKAIQLHGNDVEENVENTDVTVSSQPEEITEDSNNGQNNIKYENVEVDIKHYVFDDDEEKLVVNEVIIDHVAINVETIQSPSDDIQGVVENSSTSGMSINLQPIETAEFISNGGNDMIYVCSELDIKHYINDNHDEKLVIHDSFDHTYAKSALEMNPESVQLCPVIENIDNSSVSDVTASLQSEETTKGAIEDFAMKVEDTQLFRDSIEENVENSSTSHISINLQPEKSTEYTSNIGSNIYETAELDIKHYVTDNDEEKVVIHESAIDHTGAIEDFSIKVEDNQLFSDSIEENVENSSTSDIAINLQSEKTTEYKSNSGSNIIYETAELDIKHDVNDNDNEKLVIYESAVDHKGNTRETYRRPYKKSDFRKSYSRPFSKLTKHQIAILEESFKADKNPTREKKFELAKCLGVSLVQVFYWFEMKRKKKMNDVMYVQIFKCNDVSKKKVSSSKMAIEEEIAANYLPSDVIHVDTSKENKEICPKNDDTSAVVSGSSTIAKLHGFSSSYASKVDSQNIDDNESETTQHDSLKITEVRSLQNKSVYIGNKITPGDVSGVMSTDTLLTDDTSVSSIIKMNKSKRRKQKDNTSVIPISQVSNKRKDNDDLEDAIVISDDEQENNLFEERNVENKNVMCKTNNSQTLVISKNVNKNINQVVMPVRIKQPSNLNGVIKKIGCLSQYQHSILENVFKVTQYLNEELKHEVSAATGLSEGNVLKWFAIRRVRAKNKSVVKLVGDKQSKNPNGEIKKISSVNQSRHSILENVFKVTQYLNDELKHELSAATGISGENLLKWFSIRREKAKNKSGAKEVLSVNVETIKRSNNDVKEIVDDSFTSARGVDLQPEETPECTNNCESNVIFETAELDIKHFVNDDEEKLVVHESIVNHMDKYAEVKSAVNGESTIDDLCSVPVKENTYNISTSTATINTQSEEITKDQRSVNVKENLINKPNYLSKHQRSMLEDVYKKTKYLHPKLINELVINVGISKISLLKWFANKREREKTKLEQRNMNAELHLVHMLKFLSKRQKSMLEDVYKKTKYLQPEHINELMITVGISKRALLTWFKNKRKAEKIKLEKKSVKKNLVNKSNILSKHQRSMLEDVYKKTKYLQPKLINELVINVGMSKGALLRWFKNKQETDKQKLDAEITSNVESMFSELFSVPVKENANHSDNSSESNVTVSLQSEEMTKGTLANHKNDVSQNSKKNKTIGLTKLPYKIKTLYLQRIFQKHQYLSKSHQHMISKKLGLSKFFLIHWFRNQRRASIRKNDTISSEVEQHSNTKGASDAATISKSEYESSLTIQEKDNLYSNATLENAESICVSSQKINNDNESLVRSTPLDVGNFPPTCTSLKNQTKPSKEIIHNTSPDKSSEIPVPFNCTKCKAHFTTEYYLVRHLYRFHGIRVSPCVTCTGLGSICKHVF